MLIDIIIPAYNPGTYIIDAINSCLNQTYNNYKITVVDDCSTEDLSYLIKKYPNINLIRTQKNGGPAAARNYGIKNTSGEIISFLDADDIMDQNKLHYAFNEFSKNKSTGMVCGNYQIILYRNKLLNAFYKRAITVNTETLLRNNIVACGSVSVRRNIIEQVMFDERFWIAEDYKCWLEISLISDIKYIHKVMYFYSVIPKSKKSLTQRDDIQKQHNNNLKIIKSEITEKLNAKSS